MKGARLNIHVILLSARWTLICIEFISTIALENKVYVEEVSIPPGTINMSVDLKGIISEVSKGQMTFHAELQHPRGAFLGQTTHAVITILEGNEFKY